MSLSAVDHWNVLMRLRMRIIARKALMSFCYKDYCLEGLYELGYRRLLWKVFSSLGAGENSLLGVARMVVVTSDGVWSLRKYGHTFL